MFEVKECSPSDIKEYPALSKSLQSGCILHAFRSGGGLRVVRVNRNEKLEAYGEHPYIYNALDHAEENVVENLSYNEVYGKKYSHYMTGARPIGGLDCWTFAGHSFDMSFDDGEFKFSSKYSYNRGISEERFNRILKTGVAEDWSEDGLMFTSQPTRFPNGTMSVSTKYIGELQGYEDVWQIEKTAEFSAKTLKDLIIVLNEELPKVKTRA
jgi:hypothetical protein